MIPTKVIVPRLPSQLLHRSRLVDQLHRHADLALTLVSAPAGYGKTSLLIDFAHDAPFPVCWYSLDASDRDVSTFVAYFVAVLRRRFPGFGQTTQRILSDSGSSVRSLVGAIVQDMLDHIPEFFVLILDDYHTVDDSPQVNDFLTLLLTYRPENCHLILASRIEPGDLPMLELTARSKAAGIGQVHLAFTGQEVQALLAQAHDIHLSLEQAEELVAESEGWITGILLSTEAAWRGMRDNLVRAKEQKTPIYAYLAEQVFSEQTPELRDFLLTSSTLQEMSETLCQKALGLTTVDETLRELERRGVFITTVVDEATGVWYRYHHLFRDFLQARLQAEDPDRFCRLHQRVADWFEAGEQWESAVAHRLSAGNVRTAARTMNAGLTSLYYADKMKTLISWYEAVPEAVRVEFPRLLLFAARAMNYLEEPDRAFRVADQAEGIFEARGETERFLNAALLKAEIQHSRGQSSEVLSLVQELLSKAADYPATMVQVHQLAGMSCLDLGMPEKAVEHLQASLALCQKLEMIHEATSVSLKLANALLRMGRINEGWAHQDWAIGIYRQMKPSYQFAALLNNIAYDRYYLTSQYDLALSHLNEALQVAQSAGAPRRQAYVLLTTADLYRDLGALEHAMTLYAQAEEIARRLGNLALINWALIGTAQARRLAGSVVEAQGLALRACEQAEQQQDPYQLGLSRLVLGAAYLDSGDSDAALGEINRGFELLEQSGAQRDLTYAYTLLARAYQLRGDQEQALAALRQALDTGVKTQAYHYLVVEGQRNFALWKQLLEQNPSDRRPAEIMDRIRELPTVAQSVIGGVAPAMLPHSPALRFYGLGSGRIEMDGEPVPSSAWRSALARHLLFYLLVHPPCNLDQILDTFWPDTAFDKAQANFHNVKFQSGHALKRQMVAFQNGLYHVELEPDCWFDVAVFESLLSGLDNRTARLEKAIELYQGDFLEGHDAGWCVPVRERLRQSFLDALVELGERHLDQNQFDQAFVRLSQAMSTNNLYEPAIRALMRLHARDGRPEAALNLYRQLERRLSSKQDSPLPETRALWQEISKEF